MTHHEENPFREDRRVDEATLRALFAPHRPDAERFAAGVAERLRKVDDDGTGAETRSWPRVRTLLDRAASILPGLPKGSTLGKSWVTAISLPILLLIGVIATFVHGLRRVDPAAHDEAPPLSQRQRRVTYDFPAWIQTLGSLGALVGFAVLFAKGHGSLADLVTFVLLLGMFALIWHIGRLARSGVTSPFLVAHGVSSIFLGALFAGAVWLGQSVYDGDSLLGNGVVGWILVAGILAVHVLVAVRAREWSLNSKLTLVFILPLLAIGLPLPSNTTARVRSNLSELRLDPKDLAGWEAAAFFAHGLEVAGAEPVDLSPVRARLEAYLDSDAPEPHPLVSTSAARLGLLDREHLRRLAQEGYEPIRLDALLEKEGPLNLSDSGEYLLDCLLSTRELTAAERDHIARRVDASWPREGGLVDALDRSLACVRWLDRLGHGEKVEARRAFLHDLLRRHWVGADRSAPFAFPGGFCTYPDQRLHADIPSTIDGLRLLERVGVPDGVSLFGLNAFLRHAMPRSLIALLMVKSTLSMEAQAGMLILHHGIGLPDRTWLQAIVGERTPLAALLLVILGIRALWLAFRAERSLVGALP